MGLMLSNKTEVEVEVKVKGNTLGSVRSNDRSSFPQVPHNLMGLELTTKDKCNDPIYIKFDHIVNKDDDSIMHIFGELGHPE
ncbi:MAG: hypothetical protein MK198_05360 [Gracilimonas sp.]|jgi:hypothetical protein|uniref:hypothetical protein n=1 Tax=Gracilimonas sp. TaxID=1974203 RepID=UPI0037520DCC|nr:hypothetical protein [Gracilimonas sp.]